MPISYNRALILLVLTACLLLTTACGSKSTPTLAVPTSTPAPSATPAPTSTATPLPYPVAIRAGEVMVWQPELEAALKQMNLMPNPLPDSEQHWLAINELINEALLAQGAVENGYTLDSRAAPVDDVWLAINGYTPDIWQHSLERARAAAWQRAKIAETVPQEAEQVRARQIVFEDEAAARQALEQAQQPGADFTAMAFTTDPYTGGDLGWTPTGNIPTGFWLQTEVEQAVMQLQTGQFAPIVKSAIGYHVIKVTARETRPLTQSARRALQRQAVAHWLEERREQVEVLVEIPAQPAPPAASDATPSYEVQEGDNFYSIAARFRVSLDSLTAANPDIDPALLAVGNRLHIPGVSGVEGQISSVDVALGEDFATLARMVQASPRLVAGLNHLTSPEQLTAGSGLILPLALTDLSGTTTRLQPLAAQESLLERALSLSTSPWALAATNGAAHPGDILPGEALFWREALPSGAAIFSKPALTIAPQVVVQGSTIVLTLAGGPEMAPTGSFNGTELHFFQSGGQWLALQGIHAMSEAGLAVLSLNWKGQQGQNEQIESSLPLYEGDFPYDPPLTVDPVTIDPAITGPEEKKIMEITSPATPDRLWQGVFLPPVDSPGCTRSGFGNRRSFNGSDFTYFHSGLDYGVCAGAEIYAPAAGRVVFTGALDVRGNATIIDHGQGVYTGYWHQQRIDVKPGDLVQPGQVIGLIGKTGRITGEHLHWEVWVGGVQVNPVEWLEKDYSKP